MIDTKHIYGVALAIALVLGIAIFAGFYVHARIGAAAAIGEMNGVFQSQDARIKAAEKKADEAANKVPVIQKVEDSRVSDLARTLAQMATAKQQPVDIDALVRRLKELGIGAQPSGPSTTLPDAPSSVTVQSKPLRDYMSDCDAAHLEAGSCKIGLENKDSIIAELNTKIAADKDKIDALTIERDKAKQTVTKVQGGSAFVRAAKTVGIVAGAGLVGYGLHAATH